MRDIPKAMKTYPTELAKVRGGTRQSRHFHVAASQVRLIVALFWVGIGIDVAAVCGAGLSADWPEFRGPGGQGHSTATDLPKTWSETDNVTWRTDLPGRGWSSPVIHGNQIWMTTAIEEKLTDEEFKAQLAAKRNSDALAFVAAVRLHALCVDRDSGAILHDIELLEQKNPQAVHKMNSFASPTPIYANERLYCCFGAYGSVCIDTSTGKKLWENTELAIQHENGPGSTPVLWENRYILHCDGTDEQYLVALDAATGKIVWRTPRSGTMDDNPQLRKAYGTPLLLQLGGQTVIASPAANWVYGYDPTTGQELWKVAYGEVGFSTVPRPVTGNGLLYVATGFMQGRLLALRLGDDVRATPSLVWSFDKQIPTIPSPLLVGPHMYLVSDTGIVTCLAAEDGKVRWRERIGGNFAASPLHADGKIYLCSRDGLTTVLSDTGEFSVLAKNKLQGEILASPAAVGKAIFVRTDKAIYRLELQ